MADLFLMPGKLSEKVFSVVVSGVFLLIDGITWIYNYIEG